MDYFNLNLGSGVGQLGSGKLLIAEPLLNDPNFSRSVVFLCEHSAEGSIGFVLNQETELSFADLLPDQDTFEVVIFNGGPVQADSLHILHRIPSIAGGMEVIKGVYWGESFERLKEILSDGNYSQHDLRLFMGYSGWAPGQLANEIKEGSWLIADAPEDLLFETKPQMIWKKAVGLLGKKYSFLANVPIDPQLN